MIHVGIQSKGNLKAIRSLFCLSPFSMQNEFLLLINKFVFCADYGPSSTIKSLDSSYRANLMTSLMRIMKIR